MPLLTGLGRHRRRLLRHTAIVLGVGVAFALITLLQPFASLNWRLSDQLFLSEPASPNIVIVAIDDESLAQYGRLSEWPRSLHAQAITNLSQAGARAIGIDVLFAEASADDAVLADAISEAGNVVLPAVGINLSLTDSKFICEDFLMPPSSLQQAANAIGHANLVPDGDGVVRRLPLVASDLSEKEYPSFPVALLYTFFEQPLPESYPLADGKLHLLDRDIPVDGTKSMRINYVGGPGAFLRLSYKDVIEGNFDPEVVKHKIVLVGMTATGATDTWTVPVSADKMPGVEIYANAMDTILTQRFLVGGANWVSFLVTLFFVAISGFSLPRLSLKLGGVLVSGLFLGCVILTFLAFDRGYLFNMMYTLMSLPIVYVTAVLCRIIAEQSDRREVRGLFGRYVSPEVAGALLKLSDRGELKLGGEQREVTVLFADARGFTELGGSLPTQDVVNVLNAYFAVLIERITANGGMVNKFAGDDIMAVWNAPQTQADHPLLAVKAAFMAQQAIAEMQSRNPELAKVEFGVGINTGEAMAGSMGSPGRSEYTVIGDTVNLASRICSAAPGRHIWIGAQTYEAVKDKVSVNELEPQRFKGKSEPVPVFELVAIIDRE